MNRFLYAVLALAAGSAVHAADWEPEQGTVKQQVVAPAQSPGFYWVTSAAGTPMYPEPRTGVMYKTYVCSVAPYAARAVVSGAEADEKKFLELVGLVSLLSDTVNKGNMRGLNDLFLSECHTPLALKEKAPYMYEGPTNKSRGPAVEVVLVDAMKKLLESAHPATVKDDLKKILWFKDDAAFFGDRLTDIPKTVKADPKLLAQWLMVLGAKADSEAAARLAQGYWDDKDAAVRCQALNAFGEIVLFNNKELRPKLQEFRGEAAGIFEDTFKGKEPMSQKLNYASARAVCSLGPDPRTGKLPSNCAGMVWSHGRLDGGCE